MEIQQPQRHFEITAVNQPMNAKHKHPSSFSFYCLIVSPSTAEKYGFVLLFY